MGSARRVIARRTVGEGSRLAAPEAAALEAAPRWRDRAAALLGGGPTKGGRGAAAAAAASMEAESDSIDDA